MPLPTACSTVGDIDSPSGSPGLRPGLEEGGEAVHHQVGAVERDRAGGLQVEEGEAGEQLVPGDVLEHRAQRGADRLGPLGLGLESVGGRGEAVRDARVEGGEEGLAFVVEVFVEGLVGRPRGRRDRRDAEVLEALVDDQPADGAHDSLALSQLGPAARAVGWLPPIELVGWPLGCLGLRLRGRLRRPPHFLAVGLLVFHRPVDQLRDQARQLVRVAGPQASVDHPANARGDRPHGHRGDLALRGRVLEALADHQFERFQGAFSGRHARRAQGQRLDRRQPRRRRLPDHEVHEHRQRGHQPFAEVALLAIGGADPLGHLGDDLVEGGQEAVLLALEVLVEGRLRDARQPTSSRSVVPG